MYIHRGKMPKQPISLRLNDDLLERAKALCERDKTTLTQMLTDVLLAHVEKREYEVKHLYYSPRSRANRDKIRPRAKLNDSQRRKVKQKFNYTCQRCGITEAEWQAKHGGGEDSYSWLQVSHIVPQVQFEDPKAANTESNLTLYCPHCHGQDHRNQADYIDYNNRIT